MKKAEVCKKGNRRRIDTGWEREVDTRITVGISLNMSITIYELHFNVVFLLSVCVLNMILSP